MRHTTTSNEQRGSCLWGKGPREARASALCGRSGRGLALVSAVVFAFALPAAGFAGSKEPRAAVPADLIAAAQANPGATFDVIVQGSRGHSSSDVAAAASSGEVKRAFRSISGASVQISGAELLKLARHPNVSTITRDARMRVSAVDSDLWTAAVAAAPTWGSADAAAPQAPAIAVVDSGIDSSKADDFGSRVVARVNFSSLEPDATGDPSGHGTMVAGVAAGASAAHGGVARNAPLVDVRVASSHGEARTGDIIAAVDWIIANKAAYNIGVANFSLGGATATSFRFDPLDKAVEKLWLSGVVVTASAGNHGTAAGPVGIGAPANDPFVITVGALDVNGTAQSVDDFRAPWSAYGYTVNGFAKPELSAPGRTLVMPVPGGAYIPSQVPERVVAPGYMWMSGTSFSAPVAAGAAAQILARHPGFTPDQVKGALMASAHHLTGAGTGIGAIDVAAAVAVDSPPNPNEGLYAFVSNGGFDADAWASYVSTNSNWTESNWTESNWTESNWTESNWTESNWTESNWTESNWTESNWTESNWVE
jgi:serine protease AprX